MTTSRSESQHAPFNRRRSNTAQSVLRPLPAQPAPPLKYGDFKVLNSWVHDTKDIPVLFNQLWWPGVAEGDMLQVKGCTSEDPNFAFLFIVPKEDYCAKPQLQVRIPFESGLQA
jgi:hypothetical protein